MPIIPAPIDQTLEAIKEYSVKAILKKEDRRGYIGASEIGRPCARAIWYNYTGASFEPRPYTTLWAAQDGHRTEAVVAEMLRLVPTLNLWTHDKNGKQFGFSAFGGKFQGHADGIIHGLIQAPKANHVWECKAKNEKSFRAFVKCKEAYGDKDALRSWSEQYYVQAQCYMKGLKINRHYMTVALAGCRDIATCRTEYDKETADCFFDRAEKIIGAKEAPPRISNKPDFYHCAMCEFKKVCFENA